MIAKLSRAAALSLWAACLATGCGSDANGPPGNRAGSAGSSDGGAGRGSANTGGVAGASVATAGAFNSGAGTPSGGASVGGSGNAGASQAGSGNAGASHAGSGNAGASHAGSGNAGASQAGSGNAGAGGAPPTGGGALISSAVFYQNVASAKLDSESALVVGALQAIGWGDAGTRTTLGIDYSFEINHADSSIVPRAFSQPADAAPDCDTAPVPLVPGGKIEGRTNYTCSNDDCHLLVYQGTRLYELYQANVTTGNATGGTFSGGCLVIWDLTHDYWQPQNPPNFSRGDGCNGSDAGDMPIAPLLITKAELTAGVISHALRMTIENNRIRSAVYVHPATHIGGPTGNDSMPPYGARLRLRADYDLGSLPNAAARTVAKALQTYGMFVADGGNSYISATTDASDLSSASDLSALMPRDFQMIDGGPRINWHAQNCTRTPISK